MAFQEFVDQNDPWVKLSKKLQAEEWHQKMVALLFEELIAAEIAREAWFAELEQGSKEMATIDANRAIAVMSAKPKRLCD